jgi:hypothetical protein
LGGTVAACTGVVFAASFHVAFAIFGASLYCSPPDAAETTWWGPLIESQDRLWGIIVSWLGRGDAGVRLRALSSPRPWCLPGPLAPFSNAYSFVQGHYWGVGFLKYYQLQQLPNFLLALPILSLSIIDSTAYLLSAASQRKPEEAIAPSRFPHSLPRGVCIALCPCPDFNEADRHLESCHFLVNLKPWKLQTPTEADGIT